MASLTDLVTPGVYVQEMHHLPPSVLQVATAVPAFIGYTEKDNHTQCHLVPTRITSLLEYQSRFGGPQPETKITVHVTDDGAGVHAAATLSEGDKSLYALYYALSLFFAGGGGPCYIVSVGTYAPFGGEIHIADLKLGLAAIAACDEPSLLVFPEGPRLEPIDDYYTLMSEAVAQCAKLRDRFVIMDVFQDPDKSTEDNIAAFRNAAVLGTDALSYAAAYYPYLHTALSFSYREASVRVTVNDGSPVSMDAPRNQVYRHAVHQAISTLRVTIPPSAAVAGVYASVDASRGVWKAPANVTMVSVTDTTDAITNEMNDIMNIDPIAGKSVNAIRTFAGKGVLVWGARTLAGNSNDFRYIPVRRLFIMVEESVRKAVSGFVFEPNTPDTWDRVRALIENYLIRLWQEGALTGAKPEHAFYARVGLGTTMTSEDILNGRMIVEIGMAPLRPAEFIVLRITQMIQTG